MAFDPDEYLGAAPPAAANNAPAFDPDSYLKGEAPAEFNPNEFLKGASPADRLQALAPIVAQPNAKPEDEQAYLDAYKEHYSSNPRLQALGDTLAYPVEHPIAAASRVGAALWNTTKDAVSSLGKWQQNFLVPKAPEGESLLDAIKSQAASVGNMALGAGAGVANLGAQGLGAIGSGAEQLRDVVGDVTKDPKQYEAAAKMALGRLKASYAASRALENPYDPEKDPKKAADFAFGEAVGPLAVPLPGASSVAGAIGDAAKVGGDIIENGAYKLIGAGLKAGAAVGPAAAKASGVIGATAATAGAVHALGPLAGPAAVGGRIYKAFSKGSSSTSGMFQAVGTLADHVIATPLGENAIDSLVSQSPDILNAAYQKNMVLRQAKTAAESALKIADDSGFPTAPYKKAVHQASMAADAADLESHLLTKGTETAAWLQRTAVAGKLPRALADAFSGAVQGGILSGTISAANSQPGDDSTVANGVSKGIFYGGVLGMLGAAASAAERKGGAPTPYSGPPPPVLKAPAKVSAPNGITAYTPARYSGPPPPVIQAPASNPAPSALAGYTSPAPASPQVGPITPPDITTASVPPASTQGPPSTASVSALRKAVTDAATHTFVISGVPHDTEVMTDTLKTVAKAFTNQARIGNANETFNIATEPAKGSEHYQVMPSDQQINKLVSLHQPVESSAFTHLSYDPQSYSASAAFLKRGAKGKHYIISDILPDEFAAWKKSDSLGAHFNSHILKNYPVLRVLDNVIPGAVTPIPEGVNQAR